MFYFVKVIESLIVPPGIFIVVLVLLSLWAQRRAKRVAGFLFVIALLFYGLSTPYVANALIRPLENAYSQAGVVKGDVIVMLGGGAVFGTPDVDGEGNPTGDAANRLLTTARLARKLNLPVILTGGPTYDVQNSRVSEAIIEKRELVALGFPANGIFTESRSRNTQENAQFTKPILKAHHFTRPILVTSAYHMQRAVLEFQKAGVQVVPYPAAYEVNAEDLLYDFVWLPSINALSLSQVALHEYFGIWAAKLGVHG